MILHWLLSKTVRQAMAMRKHVQRLLCAQSDILSPQATAALNGALRELQQTVRAKAGKDALQKQMESIEKTANKWLKPYPNAAWRENVEVLLVALAVAMSIRTFFLQPFKIPTGSMQPTLFGVTSVPDFGRINSSVDDVVRVQAQVDEQVRARDALSIPTGWERVKEWFEGISYVVVKAKTDGELRAVERPVSFLIFNIKQTLWIGSVPHTIWFPPDYGAPPGGTLETRAGLQRGRAYTNGQEVVKLKTQSGDHLFVDRLTYNFRRPRRGEIVVFQTSGIEDPRMPQDQFYIKRLVALGGDRVQIGNDRHLAINGRRLDASTPHFENVYSFDPKQPPRENQYSGHVNEFVARQNARYGLAPLFPDEKTFVTVPDDHYMVMGDNTLNSFDSRSWGWFPASNVIGKSFFVYWPITSRFTWGHR